MDEITRLVWLDLETTGLDPATSDIVEMAVGISRLDDPESMTEVCHRIYQADWLRPIDPFVIDMHTKSGLIERSMEAKRPFGPKDLLWFEELRQTMGPKLILAGCTVHFDRKFLQAKGVPVEKIFSHKMFDTSSMKLLCLSLGAPQDFDATFTAEGKVESAHLASDDIRFSVQRYVRCREWLKSHFQGAEP